MIKNIKNYSLFEQSFKDALILNFSSSGMISQIFINNDKEKSLFERSFKDSLMLKEN